MNHVNLIGKLDAIGEKRDGKQYFGMKTVDTYIGKGDEVVKEENFISCVAHGRFLNTLDTLKVGHEIAVEGRLVNLVEAEGKLSVKVNDLIIL